MLTPDTAYELEAEIIAKRAGQMSTWVPLADALHRFHEAHGWELRGCDSFNEWLGQPEVWISRAEAYGHIAAWRELVLERGVHPDRLAVLDPSKVQVVVPSVRRGDVTVDEALSDCEVLSRSDLREKYQSTSASYRTCPACGQRVKEAA